MRAKFSITILSVLLLLVGGLAGCLVEDREVEIVLNDVHCEEFVEYHTSENYTTPGTLELSEDLDQLLADNDIDKTQIVDAFLVSGSYEVTEFAHSHDWDLEGIILVERTDITDGPDTLVLYTALSLEDALGVKNGAKLHADGVALIDRALDDYLGGAYPTLLLTVVSGDVEPPPTPGDPLSFLWDACLDIQVIYLLETEIVNGLGG